MRLGIDARFAGIHERGIGRYTFELVSHLLKRESMQQHEIVLFVTKANQGDFPDSSNIKKVIADIPWYSFKEQTVFPALLRQERLDLVHFPHYNVPLAYTGAFVVTIHDLLLHRFPTSNASTRNRLFFYLKHLVYKAVIRNAVMRARHIIAVSEFTKQEIEDIFPKNNTPIVVIYEGVHELDEPQLTQKIKQVEKPYLLIVGAAYPHKNIEQTLAAVGPLLRRRRLQLLVVGRGDYFQKRLRRFVRDNRYANEVMFFGEAKDSELSYLYQHAHALLFLSEYEGFGLPALEAMHYGCPVIISDAKALQEITGGAACSANSTTSDIEHCLSKIQRGRTEVERRGRAQALKYSWKTMAKETEMLYNMFTK